jgi:hypothetical protein
MHHQPKNTSPFTGETVDDVTGGMPLLVDFSADACGCWGPHRTKAAIARLSFDVNDFVPSDHVVHKHRLNEPLCMCLYTGRSALVIECLHADFTVLLSRASSRWVALSLNRTVSLCVAVISRFSRGYLRAAALFDVIFELLMGMCRC